MSAYSWFFCRFSVQQLNWSGYLEHGVVLDREGLTLPSVLVLLLVLALGRSEKEDDDEDEYDCRSAESEAAIPRRPVFRASTD